MLQRAAEVAYGEGIISLVKLAGPAAGLTRLADVCLEDLTETDDCTHIALQWNAIAADGKLFTTLLADLTLIPAGDEVMVLSLRGTYWPPPGKATAELDQAMVRRCATAVTGGFLNSVACELAHPAGTAGSRMLRIRSVLIIRASRLRGNDPCHRCSTVMVVILLDRRTGRRSSGAAPPQTPSVTPLSSAQVRHWICTGQPRQIRFASSIWRNAAPLVPIGKNRSGSVSRHAPSSRQSRRTVIAADPDCWRQPTMRRARRGGQPRCISWAI